MSDVMAAQTPPPPEPPPLPAALLAVWPVIAVGAVGWAIAVVAAFTVPALHGWRPVSLAGLAVGLLGTGIFLWQRDAARRGARGAQIGVVPRRPDRAHGPR